MTKQDLALIPYKDLVEEILSRYDYACFIGMKVLEDGGRKEYKRSWVGNTHTCIGLCYDMIWTMLQNFKLEREK